jgi:hypothetical protein
LHFGANLAVGFKEQVDQSKKRKGEKGKKD